MLTPAQQTLVTDNRNLVGFVLNRFFWKLRPEPHHSHLLWEHMQSAGVDGLVQAALKYTPTRINPTTRKPYAFSTYATTAIYRNVSRSIDSYNASPYTYQPNDDLPLDSFPAFTPSPVVSILATDRRDTIRRAIRTHLAPLDGELLELHYGLSEPPQSMPEIAARYGISKQRVNQRIQRAKSRLRMFARRELVQI